MIRKLIKIMMGCGMVCFCCGVMTGCKGERRSQAAPLANLLEKMNGIISNAPGTIGVALVTESDTLLINNGVRYPMMSVFKLHEALAVADAMKKEGRELDSLLTIEEKELDRDTWSPMLKEKAYSETPFKVSVGELMRYALEVSDNNASNVLFGRIVSPKEADAFVRGISPDTTFSISWAEEDMKRNNELAYENYTSPLAAALLIRELHTNPRFSDTAMEFIKKSLSESKTGQDRLAAGIKEAEGVYLAHKTGSGYRNQRGELAAHNDVGYFRLPDGRDYSLAVLVRDFRGSEEEASSIIAEISREVWKSFDN